MFKDLTGKITLPEGSLIKKLERIKKTSVIRESAGATISPDIINQLREELKKAPEELDKKIEELVNSKTEQFKTATESLESRFTKIEQIVSTGKKGTDEFKERLDKMDETILELLSLYEVVSSTVNPFVDDKVGATPEKLAALEKKVEELSQGAPQPSEDIENKFKALEGGMDELKKLVGSNAVNEDALIEKVAGQVLERVKPAQGVSSISRSVKASPAEESQYNEGVKLSSLDNRPETSIILLNWIEFLLEKVGRNNLTDILEYYVEIGWISEEISSKMLDHASGIDYYVERPTWKLLPSDHTKSLMFIEQLRGRKIDKNLISRLERDMNKIMRSSEIMVT